MCASRKSIMTNPETAIAAFSNTVERSVIAARRVEVLVATCPRLRQPGDGEQDRWVLQRCRPRSDWRVAEPCSRARPATLPDHADD